MTKWFTIINLNARDHDGGARARRRGGPTGTSSQPSERPTARDPRSMRARMDAYLRGDPSAVR